MEEFISNNDNFVIGGHSLGGACAILLGSYLVHTKKNVREVCTFGTPALSSDKFQKVYQSQNLWYNTYNYVLPKDPIVKTVPFYKFVGQRVELSFESTQNIWENHDLHNYEHALNNYVEEQLFNNNSNMLHSFL